MVVIFRVIVISLLSLFVSDVRHNITIVARELRSKLAIPMLFHARKAK